MPELHLKDNKNGLRILFLDSCAIVAHFIPEELAHKNIKELIDNHANYPITLNISALSIPEIINTLKSRIKNKQKQERAFTIFCDHIFYNTFIILPFSNSDPKFILDVRNSLRSWAKKSPVDAFLKATMETQLKYSGISKPILVSSDKDFCNATRKKGYSVYDPSLESFKDFLTKLE
jgi:predicted nucleic acid-binding protein